jgi:hypothetical protein
MNKATKRPKWMEYIDSPVPTKALKRSLKTTKYSRLKKMLAEDFESPMDMIRTQRKHTRRIA